jgi:conjugal transfer pilus assembly protein TraF
MERMSVARNDLKAVEAFQYYMRYVIERTSEVTNNWWYNMTQNPDLDPNVSNPISTFGIRLMTEVKQGQEREIYDLIRAEGGFLVYFTRSDCNFCHQMASSVQKLAKRTGLVVRNAALDNKCLAEFAEGCLTAPATLGPAEALKVATVPTVFLYIPKNTWLRIATGVVDLDSMAVRTTQFFAAYRAALVNGTENGTKGRPSVDFSGTEKSGASTGLADVSAGGSVTPPTQADISRLLGASTSK